MCIGRLLQECLASSRLEVGHSEKFDRQAIIVRLDIKDQINAKPDFTMTYNGITRRVEFQCDYVGFATKGSSEIRRGFIDLRNDKYPRHLSKEVFRDEKGGFQKAIFVNIDFPNKKVYVIDFQRNSTIVQKIVRHGTWAKETYRVFPDDIGIGVGINVYDFDGLDINKRPFGFLKEYFIQNSGTPATHTIFDESEYDEKICRLKTWNVPMIGGNMSYSHQSCTPKSVKQFKVANVKPTQAEFKFY